MTLCKRRSVLVLCLAFCNIVFLFEVFIVHQHKNVHKESQKALNMGAAEQPRDLKHLPNYTLRVNNIQNEQKRVTEDAEDTIGSKRQFEEYHANDDIEYDDFISLDYKSEQNIDILPLQRTNNALNMINIVKPSCFQLVKGNSIEIVKSLIFAGTYQYISKMDYMSETKNCPEFIRKRGYILGGTSEETGFPLAYSIIMYKDVEQTERLLRAIYRPHNHYCIHVDKKSSRKVQREIRSIVKCFPNVFLSSKQIHVKWGTFSVLEVELICMRDLLTKPGWKYFINLTGQEFPLKTNLEIVRILKILNGTNSVDANTQERWMARRWKKAWPPPHDIQPYKGNVHAVVSRDFVDFSLNNPKAQDFVSWLKNTSVPDETFFATLDNNPHLQTPGSYYGAVSTDYLNKPYIARFKNWGPRWGERSFNWPCRGKRVRSICIFGLGDLHLLTSRRELFANKFHINFQPQTLDCIEEWHRNRTIQEYKGTFAMSYDFYQNMPQLKWKQMTKDLQPPHRIL